MNRLTRPSVQTSRGIGIEFTCIVPQLAHADSLLLALRSFHTFASTAGFSRRRMICRQIAVLIDISCRRLRLTS